MLPLPDCPGNFRCHRPPTQARPNSPHPQSLKHNLAQAPEKLALDSLSSWLSSQITSGQSEAGLFGGPASMALGRIQVLLWNCQVQFSKSGVSADTSIYSQRRNVTYFLLQKSLRTFRVARAIHISRMEMILNTQAKGHGANGWVVL